MSGKGERKVVDDVMLLFLFSTFLLISFNKLTWKDQSLLVF